jgi:hypothetical protein
MKSMTGMHACMRIIGMIAAAHQRLDMAPYHVYHGTNLTIGHYHIEEDAATVFGAHLHKGRRNNCIIQVSIKLKNVWTGGGKKQKALVKGVNAVYFIILPLR